MVRIYLLRVAKIKDRNGLEIRIGRKSDIQIVMQFINDYWKSGHILAVDRELFEYLYLEKDGQLNFVVAIEPEMNNLIAILGFASSNSAWSRVSTSMWKSRGDLQFRKHKAGIAVFNFLIQELSPNSIFSNTISIHTSDFYMFHNYSCFLMDHFIYLNSKIRDFRIIANPPQVFLRSPQCEIPFAVLTAVEDRFELQRALLDLAPFNESKDFRYLEHRYLKNPRFKYNLFEVRVKNRIVGLIIYRRQFAMDRSCIRIVDVIGDESCLVAAFPSLVNEMHEHGDEYIDIVSWGLDVDMVKKTGLIDRRTLPKCVVPELFSPLLLENVDRWLFTNSPHTEKIYKGDGDQDRPN